MVVYHKVSYLNLRSSTEGAGLDDVEDVVIPLAWAVRRRSGQIRPQSKWPGWVIGAKMSLASNNCWYFLF